MEVRGLVTAAVSAVILVTAISVMTIPYSRTVRQDIPLDILWRSGFWQQVTGFFAARILPYRPIALLPQALETAAVRLVFILARFARNTGRSGTHRAGGPYGNAVRLESEPGADDSVCSR